MIVLILGLVIIINLILESTILPFMPLFGYTANISLVSIIILAFRRNKYYAGFFGLIIGLIYDILFGKVLGVKALIYFLIGYYAGELKNNLNNENIIVPILFSAIGTVIYNLMYFLFEFFIGTNIDFSLIAYNMFTLEILYNSVLAFIILKIYAKIFTSPSLRFGNR